MYLFDWTNTEKKGGKKQAQVFDFVLSLSTMDSEKNSVSIPWLKVIGQGYIGGIALLIVSAWKYLLGLLVIALTIYFTETEKGGNAWRDNSLRGAVGLFVLSTFITVIGIFHMLFSYKTWARIAGLFVLFVFLYGLLFLVTGLLGFGIYQCIMEIINGYALWGPIFGILFAGFFLYWFGRTCYYSVKESPKLYRWILKTSQLNESIADLQRKADCGLGPQKKEQTG
ncbi:MAG: hypothetical protein CMI31_04615 [Opitutae bacterium]|nr:hypothetical protein [Opitutae bacterium]